MLSRRTLGKFAGALVSLALFIAALWVLEREASTVASAHVGDALVRFGWQPFVLALLATAAGYLVVAFYDRIGLHVIGKPLPWRVAALGAFLSFAVGHNLGFAWLTGGAMRHRVYSRHGLNSRDVAQVTILNSVTFLLGAGVLLGALLLAAPRSLSPIASLPPLAVQATGLAMLLAAMSYVLANAMGRRSVGMGRFRLPLPGGAMALGQIGLAAVDLGLAALALWVLIPSSVGLDFPALFGIYLVALAGAVISSVPGGIGVLEALILVALPAAPRAELIAALIAYRIIYYLLPLALAICILGWRALRRRRAWRRRWLVRARALLLALAPQLSAFGALAAGTILLVSGATPGVAQRMHGMEALVPLFLLDVSHLAASLAGLGLVLLAGGLRRRLDSAWAVACVLLGIAAAGSLLKGFDWEEALLMLGLLAALLAARASFWRPGALADALASPLWLAAAVAVFLMSVGAGLLAYAPVAYRDQLWTELGYGADASRFLRSSLVVGLVLAALLVWRVARPAHVPWRVDSLTPRIRQLVAECPDSMAHLALTGDKRFLVASNGCAFLMYQVQAQSWIALGDPVGQEQAAGELIVAFAELADRHGGRAVFYQVSAGTLSCYADAGFVAHKLGEEARVDLASFNLAGSAGKSLRYALGRGQREGLAFEVVRASGVPALLPDLAAVSESWLAGKAGVEKSFSLGRFDPGYLAMLDCAVVRHEGRILAFANLWRSGDREELSVDLMRHLPDAPAVVMRYLFGQLLLLGQQEGFRWFNLGMAPMSGMARHRLAPAWHRMAGFLFDHGERFYGFAGLREFKDSFHPVWRPRYICCRPGTLALARGLADVSRLISRTPPGAKLAQSGSLHILRKAA